MLTPSPDPPDVPGAPSPDAPLSRRERERVSRRAAMLEAAREVFAEKGYEAARLDEIADRSEFGKGTLYNYFEGGKAELLFAIVEAELDGLRARIVAHLSPEATHGRSVRDVFRGLLGALVGHFEGNRETFLIVSKEVPRILFSNEPEQVERLHVMYARTVGALVPAIEAAQASGAMRRIDARGVAHLIFDNVHAVLMAGLVHEGRGDFCREPLPFPDPVTAADFLAVLLLDGLVTAPSAPFVPGETPAATPATPSLSDSASRTS